jgi:hypothetical protein
MKQDVPKSLNINMLYHTLHCGQIKNRKGGDFSPPCLVMAHSSQQRAMTIVVLSSLGCLLPYAFSATARFSRSAAGAETR